MSKDKSPPVAKDLQSRIKAVLAEDGLLSESIEGYESREAQLALAWALGDVIESKETFLAEAGTGTGKTFAYLIPALLSGKQIIISTATKNLQEQLVEKDLPMLLKLLKIKGKATLLKGRDNYFCPQRFEIAETGETNSKQAWKKLDKIRVWSESTKVGDKSEVTDIDENDPVWARVNARMEFCQATDCHPETNCFYPKAKQAAGEARILVVNHHLFCADLALKENGYGEILPESDVFIFDEAHKLPDIAAQFLGFTLSRNQLEDLVRDIKNAQILDSPESSDISDQAQLLQDAIATFNQALGKWEKRWTWKDFSTNLPATKTINRVLNQLTHLEELIKPLVERGKSISSVHKRTQAFQKELSFWLNTDSEFQIRWLESSQARFKLNLTPLSVAAPFNRQREEAGGAWIFTSATLSVNGQFDYFSSRLGLSGAKTGSWESPFDYQTQGVVFHPIGLPQPRDPEYIKVCLRAIWPILIRLEGRAFLLFTSHRALQEARVILQAHWVGHLWVQGDAPKRNLLNDFRAHDHSILLGTSSFWEGVDVRGDDLRLVMIDRLPFSPPDDPVVQAREAYLKEKGLHGFMNFQLPESIIAMKQGSGRLIRDTKDTGILVLCDPRLSQKPYGKMISTSLPHFPWVYDLEGVNVFLDGVEKKAKKSKKGKK